MALQRINTIYEALRIDGNLTVVSTTANVYLGNITYPLGSVFASNIITTNSGVIPNANATQNLGSTSAYWNNLYVKNSRSDQITLGGQGMTVANGEITPSANAGSSLGTSSLYWNNSYVRTATVDTQTVSSSTTSTTSATGALVVTGGTGIGGQLFVGGNIVAASSQAASSTTTGALVVTGGAGIGGQLFVGANVNVTGNILPTANVTYNLGSAELRWKDLFLSGSTINLGGTTISAPTGGALAVSTGNIIAASSQASTSTTTGALVVTGGVGIGGNIFQSGWHVPSANVTHSLGSTTAYWNNLYAKSLISDQITLGGQGMTIATGAITPAANAGASLGSASLYWDNSFARLGTFNQITIGGQGIIPAANTTVNLGSVSTWFNTFYGVSTQAKYADLAENYRADRPYPAGTVLEFGGTAEVTIGTVGTTRVAGVVSSNPAHLMNGALQGPNVVPLALLGSTMSGNWTCGQGRPDG